MAPARTFAHVPSTAPPARPSREELRIRDGGSCRWCVVPIPRVSGDFWDQELTQQTCALVLLGEQIRGIPLPPGLQELLCKGPPLPLALRVALQEERWLIDVRGLERRERQRLEPHVAEFEGLSGVACTLLTSESTRQHLAGLADDEGCSSQ